MSAPAMHQTPPEGPAAFLGTEPVAAGPYYRDDYFELEREAVFRRCWLQIGHISELPEPGTFIVRPVRSEEHTSELQSLMRNSYAVFCLKKKKLIILRQCKAISSTTI